MLHQRMQARVPSAKPLFLATLKEHDLRFHKVGVDDSGKADAYFTGSDSDFVIGVVYWMSRSQKRVLDRAEGRPKHYQMKWVTVFDKNEQPVKVFTYVAQIIDETFKPSVSYKRIVVYGAEQNGITKTYINKIKRVKDQPDVVSPAVEVAKLAVQRDKKVVKTVVVKTRKYSQKELF
jgi:cation transport regulator ChaC